MQIPGRFTDRRRGYTFKKSTGASESEIGKDHEAGRGKVEHVWPSESTALFRLTEAAHFLLSSDKHRVGDSH